MSKIIESTNIDKKQKLGQVFTPKKVVNRMMSLSNIRNLKNKKILEPSVGNGVFWTELEKTNNKLSGVEIDNSLSIDLHNVENIDFFKYFLLNDKKKFDLIIGNPPYVKFSEIDKKVLSNIEKIGMEFKHRPNLYQYFLFLSLKMLNEDGVLVFIIPSEVFLKSSSNQIVELINKEYSITHYEIMEENIWDNASVSTAIIRIKKKINDKKKINYIFENGKIFFNTTKKIKLKGFVSVKVGAVPKSKSEALLNGKLPFVNSQTNTTGKTIKYNYIKENWIRPLTTPPIKNFEKIYVNCKTRSEKPFFTNKCNNFDGSILCIYFKKGTNVNSHIKKLNSIDFEKMGLKRSGRLVLSQSILTSILSD